MFSLDLAKFGAFYCPGTVELVKPFNQTASNALKKKKHELKKNLVI